MAVRELQLRLPSAVLETWHSLEMGASLQMMVKNADEDSVFKISLQRKETVAELGITETVQKKGVLEMENNIARCLMTKIVSFTSLQGDTGLSQDGKGLTSHSTDVNSVKSEAMDEEYTVPTHPITVGDKHPDDQSALADAMDIICGKEEDHFESVADMERDEDDDDLEAGETVSDDNDTKQDYQSLSNHSEGRMTKKMIQPQSMGTMPRRVLREKKSSSGNVWKCCGCDRFLPNRHCLLSHMRRKHAEDLSIWLQYEENVSSMDKRGIEMRCLVCEKPRQGKGIFRHLNLIHKGLENFSQVYDKTKEMYDDISARAKKQRGLKRSRELRSRIKSMSLTNRGRGRPKKSSVADTKESSNSDGEICPGCSKSFTFRSNLFTHIKKVHKNDRQLLCKVEERNSAKCTQGPEVNCPVCGQLRMGRTILRHFEVAHSDLPNYGELYQDTEKAYLEKNQILKQETRRKKLKESSVEQDKPVAEVITLNNLATSFCLFCHCPFESTVDLTNHMFSEHQLPRPEYEQMITDYDILITKDLLDPDLEHKYTKTVCALCAVKFGRGEGQVTFAQHLRLHNLRKADYLNLIRKNCVDRNQYFSDLKKRKSLACPVCSISFTMMNNLRAHVLRAHANDKEAMAKLEDLQAKVRRGSNITSCLVCGQERVGTSIIKHMKTIHAKVNNFQTLLQETKDMLRQTQRANAQHRTKARGPVSHSCKYCNEEFTCRTSKFRHQVGCEKNPEKSRLIRCKYCSYWTQFPERVEAHIKKCHSDTVKKDPFVCHLCGRSYNRRTSLQVHMGSVHGITRSGPAKTYECPVCNKQFMYSVTRFREHLAIHSAERNHMCPLCGKAFKTNDNLRSHIRLFHKNQYPYQCAKCGHGVQHKRYLDAHVCGRVRRRQDQEKVPDDVIRPVPDDIIRPVPVDIIRPVPDDVIRPVPEDKSADGACPSVTQGMMDAGSAVYFNTSVSDQAMTFSAETQATVTAAPPMYYVTPWTQAPIQ